MKTTTMIVKESFTDRGFKWDKGDTVTVDKEQKAILIAEDIDAVTYKKLLDENFDKLEDKKNE